MLVSDFDFQLPPELIAQTPAPDRNDARLLHLPRTSGPASHHTVAALPDLLQRGDLIVVNDTRVFPARLIGRRVPSGGAVECFLLERIEAGATYGSGNAPAGSQTWKALVHPGQKLKPGARLLFEAGTAIHGEILEWHFHGRRLVRLWTADGSPLDTAVDAIGHMPLPPYIKREDVTADRDRYQTIFAERRGSVAAPTAGLHFTSGLVDALRARGIEMTSVTLHVGYGTFQPVRVDRVEDHAVEPERYAIEPPAAAAIASAKRDGRRVIAVGTTTTRTLESVALATGGRIEAGTGTANLFVHPGFEFRIVDGLLTNFHLPRSSLLMLVSAFGGRERILAAYAEAIARRYRFYSYGDAMLIA